MGHQRHVQSANARLNRVRKGGACGCRAWFFVPSTHGQLTACGADYSDAPDFTDLVPRGQGPPLVFTNEQEQLRLRVFGMQFMQGVHRVAGTGSAYFALVHHHGWQIRKGQSGHGHAVGGIRQLTRFVPSIARGQHTHLLELQLHDGRLHQGHMRQVRWIKSPTKNTQTLYASLGVRQRSRQVQTQSLGTRK